MTQQEQKANNKTKHWDEQIASYWSNVIEKGGFANAVYWLGNPIVNRFYQSKAVGGRTYPHWVNFCVDYYLGNRCPADRMLSVGCGDGDLERHLVSLNAFKALDGIDSKR
jgi:hypothetical protein